jgi:hypothetical protein
VNKPTPSELEAVRRAWSSVAENETIGMFLWNRGKRVVLASENGEAIVVLCLHPFNPDTAFFGSTDRRHDEEVPCHCLVYPWLALAMRIEAERLAARAACPPDPSAPEPRMF